VFFFVCFAERELSALLVEFLVQSIRASLSELSHELKAAARLALRSCAFPEPQNILNSYRAGKQATTDAWINGRLPQCRSQLASSLSGVLC
jgi:hypothetical protein